MASAMMLTLMGCGGASTEATSETGEVTESQSETKTDSDNTTDDNDANAETSEASEDASETSDSATADDASFEYKGKTLSFTDDAQTVIDALDSVEKQGEVERQDVVEGVKWYDWHVVNGNPDISLATQDDNGKTIIGYICGGHKLKTSKGIESGSSREEVKTAYGEPSRIREIASNYEIYYYKFDSFELAISIMDDAVDFIVYQHDNYIGK